MSSLLNNSKIKAQKSDNSYKLKSNEAEEILQIGVENIYHSFNILHKNYNESISFLQKEVNTLSQKIETMKKEIEMIQRENKYYKEKNNKLNNEIEKLNKVVSHIKNKLTNEGEEINNYIKSDNIKSLNLNTHYKINNNKSKDNNNYFYLYNTYKNSINNNNNNKNEKNKLIHFCLNENNNSLNLNNDNKKYDDYNSSVDLNLGITIHNNKYLDNREKNRFLNSFNNKHRSAHISREAKIRRNNYIDKFEDIPVESSFDKNKNNSSNKYTKDTIENNKITDEDIDINNEDININEINNILLPKNNNTSITKSNKIKKFGQKVCLTYENLFNNNIKEINKNSYNTFRRKIFNKNISEKILKKDKNHDKEKVNYFLAKCKSLLDKESVEKIINIFQDYKEGLITDKGILCKIKNYISNNNELIKLFNEVFSK